MPASTSCLTAYIELHAVGPHLGNVRYRQFRRIGSLSAQHRHTQSEDAFLSLIQINYLWFKIDSFSLELLLPFHMRFHELEDRCGSLFEAEPHLRRSDW